jgi:hypothetical protein
MKKVALIVCFLLVIQVKYLHAQELRCRVNVIYSEIPDADKEVFNNLRKTVEEFMNNQIWTDHVYEENEKIDMKININVQKQNSNKNFSGSIQVQSSRPVYNSTYTSTMFNYFDEKFNFTYEENQTIEFSENTYIANLSSVLAFYAYIVIGIDYDSFSMLGGTPYFQKAQNIATAASGAGESGWNTSEKENRYWLIENILNSTYAGFRSAMYIYHRLGLDIMYDKPVDGRKQVIEALTELEKVYRVKPSAFLLNVFFLAKKDEIIQMFSEALPDEKQQMVALAKKMNPGNASEYDKLLAQ